MAKNILPTITLKEPERKWLELVYKKVQNSEKISYRLIRTELYKEIPKDFHPKQINQSLIDSLGERITLLGIYAIDPNTYLLEKANKIIRCIKDIIVEKPDVKSITSASISEQLKIKEEEVGFILSLITRYRGFYSGASHSQSYNGFSSIDIGEGNEVFDQYLYFDSIEKLIAEEYQREKVITRKASALKKGYDRRDYEEDLENGTPKSLFHSKIPPVDPKLCFVLMPFSKEWSDRVYKDYIRENIEEMGLQCLRADNLKGPIVIEDIWVKINQAAFIIADVTDMNPNVMYELGIVHAIGKPAILITQDILNIPFDFKHLRHYPYKDNLDGYKEFETEIKENVIDLYKHHYPEIVLNR